MDNNATDSGGPVTRSLRKRLASVDNDISSRPGTPISSKLTAISQISASPSRPTRMTRRNSTSGIATPVKTPAKRVAGTSAIMENLEIITPTKTRTRRSSFSINEKDEFSQKGLKILTALDEETLQQSDQKPTRVRRSQSKSPLLSNSCNTSPNVATPVKTPAKLGVSNSATAENLKTITPTKLRNFKTNENEESSQKCLQQSDQNPTTANIGVINTAIVENLKTTTPTKTRTPRIITSTSENEENSQKGLQIVESHLKPTRVTRSQSKSPVISNSLNTFSSAATPVKNSATRGVSNLFIVENSKTITDNKIRTPSIISKNENENRSQKDVQIEQSEQKPTRVTRSQSTSPTLSNSFNTSSRQKTKTIESKDKEKENENIKAENLKKRKPGPKSKTRLDRQLDEDFSDIEINVFGNGIECIQNKSSNIIAIDFTDAGPAHNNKEENKLKAKEVDLELSHPVNFCEKESLNINELQTEKNNCDTEEINIAEANIEVLKDTIEEKRNQETSVEEQNMNILDDNTQNNIINVRNSPKTKNELKCDEITLKENKDNLSNVEVIDYNDVDHFNLKDSTTPKARHSFKQIRSTQDDDPSQAECNSFAISLDNNQNEMSRSEDIFVAEVKPMLTLISSQVLEEVQSTTPNNKQEDLSLIEEKNTVEAKVELQHEESNETNKTIISTNIISDEDNNGHSPNQNKDELKWINPSVKCRTSDGSKLDVVVNAQYNTNENKCCDNTDNDLKQIQKNQKKMIIFSSEDEGERYDEDNYDEGEESYKQQHDFDDDQAVEVHGYESGDSMDSEERKELEENEILDDGVSIGNQTTDDDQDECAEEEDSENDSFIASDGEELKFYESDDEDEETDKTNKVTYKRIQRLADSSSSSDEEVEDVKQLKAIDDDNINGHKGSLKNLKKDEKVESHNESLDENITQTKSSNQSITDEHNLLTMTRENIILDSSKLSDSALRLYLTDRSESGEENNTEETNMSSKEILHKLTQSDCFNKSIRNLNPETGASPTENGEASDMIEDKNNDEKSFIEEQISSTSPDESANNTSCGNMKRPEIHLGEVSVTSESDADKENDHKSMHLSHDRNSDTGLSVSFGNYNEPKGKQEFQRSFTIDVTVKRGELEADIKLNESVSTSSSSVEYQENELESEDIKYQENSTQGSLPLGNPLIRTRRQSLALPINPDMEICSSSHAGGAYKKLYRKSLGILSSIDFKPSQSFIDTIELQKCERKRLAPKRKRLSKSFCGAPETHDNSIIDVDICHLHKRSKLMDENSIDECQDSIENMNSSKLFTKISSTPHEKINKNYSYNSERILTRCDEIIEAANRAKLELKIKNRKKKTKISKKQLKNKYILVASEETKPDDTLRGASKEIKRKDKIKTALSHAIMAADVILSKKKKIARCENEQETVMSKPLAPDVVEDIAKFIPTKKKYKKEIIHKQQKMKDVHTFTSTSAGNFIDLPQSPKRKKSTYIQLVTGKVSVEPITPKKRSVKAYDGSEFRESPVTPHAVGFKVSKIVPSKKNVSPSSITIIGKRKRYNESFKDCTKAQWTKAGLFTEEDISKTLRCLSQKPKKRQEEKKEDNVNCNFKEKSILRPEIRRSTKREILLLKERRNVRD